MFEQTFKNMDDILYKDAVADSELDYIEQTSSVTKYKALALAKKELGDKQSILNAFIEFQEYLYDNKAVGQTL
jgi:type I restriction enzyme M protein